MLRNVYRMNENGITSGGKGETTQRNLGDYGMSPANVPEAVRDQQEDVKVLRVEKGGLFPKKLEAPAHHIQEIDCLNGPKVRTHVTKSGSEDSVVPGAQERPHWRLQGSLLNSVGQWFPRAQDVQHNLSIAHPCNRFWQIFGSGLLSGTSGNDPSAVTTYAIDGATTGYGHLWLMLLSMPLYQAVQFACAKIGCVSNKGLSQLLREYYGRPVAVIASLLLILTNTALIAADLMTIGSGLELVTGLSWIWFVVPAAFVFWYLTISHNFETFKKIFLTISLVLVACVLAAFSSHALWGTVLTRTFVPQLGFDFESMSSIVALLGATISPYSMFWQAEGEIEEQRTGDLKQQLHAVNLDVGSGAISGQAVAYFIIVMTASTLFVHHATINTATDAARLLEPLAGPLARYLFAFGLIGSGIVAIPVLLVSTSYGVAGSIGWPSGLSKLPWQAQGFYLILTVALVIGLFVALLGINPINLIFWANVLAGVIAPLLVIAILLVGNNRRIMRGNRLSLLNNVGLVLVVIILMIAAGLLFYGLAAGQGGL